jgi:helix-turn-helix protein
VNNDPNIVIENELLRKGFTSIPNYIFGLPISSNAKLIYMALLSYAWTNNSCYPGLATLCKDVSLSDKPVTKAIGELCEALLLEVKRRGQGKTNLYILKEFDLSNVQNRKNSDSRIGAQNRKNSESRNGDNPKLKAEKLRIHEDKRSEKEKEEKDTHTNGRATRAGVGVGSKFSLEECRQYAEHLRKTGQGITNPGGFATTIYRTGEADLLIEEFLAQASAKEQRDLYKCPDCKGMNYYYPEGIGRGGVAKCKHLRLSLALQIEEQINQLRELHAREPDYGVSDLIGDLKFRCQREQILWDELIISFLLSASDNVIDVR